jgi:DNA-binding CsgD family transcriptional regulator
MREQPVEARISELLPRLYALQPIESFPEHVLPLVRALVGGNKADYTEVDLTSGNFYVLVDPVPPQLASLVEARRAYMHGHPLLHHFLTSLRPDARLTSDFLTRREYHRLDLYGEFFHHVDVEDQLTVALAAKPESTAAAVSIDRDKPSFTNRDRRTLDLLRPHLAAARANAQAFSRALAAPFHAHQPNRLDRLTSRQLDVLEGIAAGRTNDQIALELTISAGTVRKHVEHILQRLQATTRTAAAAILLTSRHPHATTRWTQTEPGLASTAADR